MIQHPNIDPVLLDFGWLQLRWYGLMYVFGIAFAWWLAHRRLRAGLSALRAEQIESLMMAGVLGIILGGRVGYMLFYGFERLAADPLSLFRVWEGGMSFHGGLLGVVLAVVLVARSQRIPIGDVMDVATPLAPMGLGLGRLGNFIGQELWGRPTDLPWGMVYPADPLGIARHPSQLYQFALEGIVLFAVLLWLARRPQPRWLISGSFVLGYGLLRFLVEFVREPDSHIGFDAFDWMTRGQVLSMPMIAIGVLVIAVAWRRPAYADLVAPSKPGAAKR